MPTLLTILLVCALNSPFIHKLDDGFVERSLAVTIRDSQAKCEYRIGLNNNTMTELVARWKEQSAHPEEKEKNGTVDSSTSSQSQVDSSANSEAAKPTANSLALGSESATDAAAAQQVEPLTTLDSSTPRTSKIAQETKEDYKDETHWLDPRVLEELRELAKTQIIADLDVKIDGQPIKVLPGTIGAPPRHPFYLVINFEFDVPDSGSFDVDIADQNFAANDGAVRYSLKALGRSMLLKSNVAPTIIRAKRLELGQISAEDRKPQTVISARLGVQPPPGNEK